MAPLRRRLALAAFGLLAAGAVCSPASAQARMELIPAVQQSLLHLQEQWIQWQVAFGQDNPQRTGEILTDLQVTANQLGMKALPDLAVAALSLGVQAAREGDFERARLALAAAERLDPGRPESAFARARVERLAGRWPQALSSSITGYLRILDQPLERSVWLADAAVELLYALLLAGALFVALALAVHGRRLFADLATLPSRGPGPLPPLLAVPLALALLLWPLALPAGLAWLVLWWSVLLWTYGSPGERVVLVLLWLVVGLVPLAVAQLRDEVRVGISPPVQALDRVVGERLYGSLFSDLALVQELLPGEPGVDHLMADVHRRLGQWERARRLYERVLEEEPDNWTALVDLGSYYFYKNDLGAARERFLEATKAAPREALPWFNLNRAYLAGYLFKEGGEALEAAQELGGPEVGRWMDETGEGSVLNANGGLGRVPALRDRLAEVLTAQAGEGARAMELLRQGWSLLVSLGLLVGALAYHALRRRFGAGPPPARPPSRGGRWFRLLVPGLASLRAGRGAAAAGALLLPALLMLVALDEGLGFAVPVRYAHGGSDVALALAGLVLLVAGRAVLGRWREG